MKRAFLILGAVVLVFAGASVAVAQTDDGADTPFGRVGGLIGDVLDGLVSDGTLTQDQADAVGDAIATARDEHWAERQAMREGFDAARQAFHDAWADDVLTQDEAASLGDLGPMSELLDPDGPLADYWADGELTRDEVSEARESGVLGFGRGPGRGYHHHGFSGGAGGPATGLDTGGDA